MGLPHAMASYEAGAATGRSSSQPEQNQGLGSAVPNQQFQTHSWAKQMLEWGSTKMAAITMHRGKKFRNHSFK